MLRNSRRIIVAVASVVATGVACTGAAAAQSFKQDLAITANVPSTCSLGGTSTPADLNTTIPITPGGSVVTATQTFLINNVFCTRPTSIVAVSMNGGLKSATNPGTAFTNIINYTATARYGLALSTINTATIPTANGSEAGNAAPTLLPWLGTLRIQLTPAASPLPLAGGNDYNDVLRILLTPE